MDESIKKALENSLVSKSQIEKKILSLYESVNSKEEETQRLIEACDMLENEYGYNEEDAVQFVSDVLWNNHIELPSDKEGDGCVTKILAIAVLIILLIGAVCYFWQ